MTGIKSTALLVALCGGAAGLGVVAGGCSTKEKHHDSAKASLESTKDWQAELTPRMKNVLDAHAALGPKPIENLTPAEARTQPSPADAVRSLLTTKDGKAPEPEAVGNVVDQPIPNANGKPIPARIYTPKGTGPFPVILYIHGGGWVIATVDTYDSSPRALCNQVGAVVVSIEYRKGPEDKFPASHDDAFAAYQWLTQNAASINGKQDHIDVVGESAGGNMAISTAIAARDRNVAAPKHIVAVYPVAQLGEDTPSIQKYATAKPLNKPMLAWFGGHYLPSKAEMANPRINLLKADLKNLPPTTIIGAQIDPLASEGKMLADKLKEAGVSVRYKLYPGVTHEFFGMTGYLPEAKAAVEYAADGLKDKH